MTLGVPIILPRDDDLMKLVKTYHEQIRHGGAYHTQAALSEKFWIIAVREAVGHWQQQCYQCKRGKAATGERIMALLRPDKSQKSLHALITVSVDYAAPFLTQQGRGKTRLNRYGTYLCLFTCMANKAVHLVTDLFPSVQPIYQSLESAQDGVQ